MGKSWSSGPLPKLPTKMSANPSQSFLLTFPDFQLWSENHVTSWAKVWPFLQSKRLQSRLINFLRTKLPHHWFSSHFVDISKKGFSWKVYSNNLRVLLQKYRLQKTKTDQASIIGWRKSVQEEEENCNWKSEPEKIYNTEEDFQDGRKNWQDSWLEGDQVCFEFVWSPSTSCPRLKKSQPAIFALKIASITTCLPSSWDWFSPRSPLSHAYCWRGTTS